MASARCFCPGVNNSLVPSGLLIEHLSEDFLRVRIVTHMRFSFELCEVVGISAEVEPPLDPILVELKATSCYMSFQLEAGSSFR